MTILYLSYPPDFNGPAQAPAFSTTSEPGSEEKIRIMTHRCKLKQCLHHRDDVNRLVSGLYVTLARGIREVQDFRSMWRSS